MPRAKKPPPTQEEMLAQADSIVDDLIKHLKEAQVTIKQQDRKIAKGGKLMKELLHRIDAQTDKIHGLQGHLLFLSRIIAEDEMATEGDTEGSRFVMRKIEEQEKLLKRALANEKKSREGSPAALERQPRTE